MNTASPVEHLLDHTPCCRPSHLLRMVVCIVFTTLQVGRTISQGLREVLAGCMGTERSKLWAHAAATLQTSYLLLFTVGVDCGKKSGGYKNYYFPDHGVHLDCSLCCGELLGAGRSWQAEPSSWVGTENLPSFVLANQTVSLSTRSCLPPLPSPAGCFDMPHAAYFGLSVVMLLVFQGLSALFALIECGASEPLSRNYLSLSSGSAWGSC